LSVERKPCTTSADNAGIRPPVSTWPPSDPDEADEYRLEAKAVLLAVNARGAVEALREAADELDMLGPGVTRASVGWLRDLADRLRAAAEGQ
jgi:hypothetical protein